MSVRRQVIIKSTFQLHLQKVNKSAIVIPRGLLAGDCNFPSPFSFIAGPRKKKVSTPYQGCVTRAAIEVTGIKIAGAELLKHSLTEQEVAI
jgi:hypothetical protein